MHRSRMLRMMDMMVRMKKIMAVLVDVGECPVLIRSVLMIMPMGMEVLIMSFIGILGVVMVVTMRHLMSVPVIMIIMRVLLMDMTAMIMIPVPLRCMAVVMSMSMLIPFMHMSRNGRVGLPFLSIRYE
jgi:hypothetical protein